MWPESLFIRVKSVNSLIQSSLLLVAVLAFFSQGYGLDALYGAMVSATNTCMYEYFMHAQKTALNASAHKSIGMALKSSAIRVLFVTVLTLIGLGLIKLDPSALVASLVVGQVGFILDRIRQK